MPHTLKKILFAVIFTVLALDAQPQNVGINTTGVTPSSNSVLDLNTGNNFSSPNGKGLLPPNVSLTGITDNVTVASPSSSLLVYNTATSKKNSATNKENPATNKKKAATNKENPATNKKKAATNKKNATANRKNAATNKKNTAANRKNAATNNKKAATESEKGVTEREKGVIEREKGIINRNQINQLNMMDTVDQVLSTYSAVWSSNTAISIIVSTLVKNEGCEI